MPILERWFLDWDYFDRIYCISLDERPDRRKEAKAQFSRVGLLRRVEFVRVQKHPVDCEQGIYESHVLCMNKGLAAGAKNILIFEDDICFNGFNSKALQNAIFFLSTHKDWNILFFGCMVRGNKKTENESILKIRFRSLCHAYLINAPFAKKLVEIPWQKVPLDDMLRDLKDDHFYAIYPSFSFQSNSRSDNERCLHLDRFRRACGGLQCIQKYNEIYHRNRSLVIGAHALIVMVVFVFLMI